MSIVFHPEASVELNDAAFYYESKQPGLGLRFQEEVRLATLKIPNNVELFRVIEQNIRKCRVRRFPYGILFRQKSDRIEIVAVMHLHREPGYWKIRLE